MQMLTFSSSSTYGTRLCHSLHSCRYSSKLQPRLAARRRWVSVQGHNKDPGAHDRVHCRFNIHGRHVVVTPELEHHVKGRLLPIIDKFRSPAFVESEGGVREVDVRLMNTSAQITVIADVQNKQHHDTYLRMGALKAISSHGADVYDSFEAAVQQLEHKLKAWTKDPPRKMDPKHSSQLRQHGSV